MKATDFPNDHTHDRIKAQWRSVCAPDVTDEVADQWWADTDIEHLILVLNEASHD